MSGFRSKEDDGITIWTGDPDSEAAHAQVLIWIRETGQPFLPRGSNPSERIVGNVAELVAFRTGRTYAFPVDEIYADAVNAHQPID